MALAQIGPLTTVLETAATAIGAGVVVGGATVGVVRLTMGWSRGEIEDAAEIGGVVGGGLGVVAAVVDLVLRYAGAQ
jgi:hypothetical protein